MSYNIQNFNNGDVLSASHLHNIENALINTENAINDIKHTVDNSIKSLYGLNVLCLGDSITIGQGMTADTRWNTLLANKYNWNLTVQAAGGISLSSYWYTTNNSSNISIVKKAEKIKTMSPKPDIVLVWGGHNDVSYRESPLGTWDDTDSNSFKGALKCISQLVHEYAPNATLFVLTREWTSWDPLKLEVPSDTSDTSADFDKAIIEGAHLYGWVPINMQLCGITPYTKNKYTGDGIHPNKSGTDLIVSYLESELSKYYRIPDLEKVPVTNIEINKSQTNILSGGTEQLYVNIKPSNATDTTIIWSSEDNSIATISNSGLITGVNAGTTTITAKTKDSGLIDSIVVNISDTTVALSGVKLSQNTYTCQQSSAFTLSLNFIPQNATNQNVLWESSNTEVAIVNGGFVKALREGTAIITATSIDGGYLDICNLTVTA